MIHRVQWKVVVKVIGAGLCHSDLSVINGTRGRDVPMVMGHEGAGEVVETGSAVTDVQIGDHVAFQFSVSCGRCRSCLSGRPNICERAPIARLKGELLSGGSGSDASKPYRCVSNGGVLRTGWIPSTFHMVHNGKFAMGRAGVVFVEETAVTRTGRITNGCLGLWDDAQPPALADIASFLSEQGSVPAIQIAHGRRKAST